MRQQKSPPARASLRSHAAATVTSLTLRPLTSVIPANRPGILVARRIVATTLALTSPRLPGSRIVPVDRSTRRGPSVRGEWVRGPKARRNDAVILYIHGSGYAICSARTHRGITTRLSEATGLPVFACDYRLAPSHQFPAAADDVRAAYSWLLSEGHDPDRIVVAGDSAGGHLAVDLALQLLREGATPPAALVLLSPLVDPTLELARACAEVRPDPMAPMSVVERLLDLYFADADLAAPRLTFTFDDVSGFPPTLIQAGGREFLRGDAEALATALDVSGAHCELEVWPGQMHVFQALLRVVPEAVPALASASDFIVAELDAAERRSSFSVVESA
ncbi:alpha/beta hydrolase [Nocardioides humilatus]|uniref:Alpha/beta hydrolase n=1 Tax=Nocardioides humilatus TaxID=2607660 RepID=A0A5B1L8N1_9ACTN|nr:alpha/beta hydrolase [Nocardioides humilatus]KAA1416806.1 alpha/beta hydrolase [Nocardioides humilatus]